MKTLLAGLLLLGSPQPSQPPAVDGVVAEGWTLVQGDAAIRHTYEALSFKDDTWYDSTFWTGPDWTRVGADWQHSGTGVNSVRVFNAPKPGQVTVTGRAYKADTKCGDGVVVAIRGPEGTLWEQAIDFADTQGAAHELSVDLGFGQKLRFVVARRGEIPCDTTYWDPVVTYADGTAYRASEGFSDKVGLWSYEMETEDGPTDALAPGWEVQQWRSPDGTRGALRVRRRDSAVPEQAVRFAALEPGAVYRLNDRASGQGAARTGDDLMRTGLNLALPAGGELTLVYEAAEAVVSTAVPDRPVGLQVSLEGRLTWDIAGGAFRWVVWRDGDVIARVRDVSYHDTGLLPGHAARYAVQAELRFVRSAPAEVAMPHDYRPELDLWKLVEEDWAKSDGPLDAAGYAEATEDQLRRAQELYARLRPGLGDGPVQKRLATQNAELATDGAALDARRQLYLAARWLKRNVALSDPLLDFGPLLFAKRVPTEYSHLVMQYFGWRARPGGGICVLEEPGRSLKTRNILEGQLEGGSVLAPCLSWDGTRIVFSYSHCAEEDPFFHIYEVGADGSGLRQLTSGEYEDLMPAYLPDGGIIFCSTRRRGYARCFGGQFGDRWHVYTLHRMDSDGANLRTLSFHETNEWFPSVLHDGSVSYARWDYVDRHPVVHQNLWRTNPDGTGASVLWGNHTQVPHCTFEAQPIPGSRKIIATGAPHHSITGGSLFIIDPSVDYDGHAAIERITPEVKFPEAEGWIGQYYATPWPLSEDVYLVSYSHTRLVPEPEPNDPAALGLYYLDRWGNRELLYRDAEVGATNPVPLRSRTRPPVLQSVLPEGAPPEGKVLLLDVHRGLPEEFRGQVKALRVMQILPKATPVADGPPVGLAGQEPARMVLGTVPVEPDGSAYFTVPARKPLFFQALDERGMAIHTMRSAAYLQPGEEVSCVGCHEPRTTAPDAREALAMRREPSEITPGPKGSMPFSFVQLVQPVLDRHCVRCHGDDDPPKGLALTSTPQDQWTRSYVSLTGGKTFYQADTNAENAAASLVPRYGGWNPVHDTPVGGLYGSRGSRLMKMLLAGHEDVELDADSIERLATWIDSNAVFYGTYDAAGQAKQLGGEDIEAPALQ